MKKQEGVIEMKASRGSSENLTSRSTSSSMATLT